MNNDFLDSSESIASLKLAIYNSIWSVLGVELLSEKFVCSMSEDQIEKSLINSPYSEKYFRLNMKLSEIIDGFVDILTAKFTIDKSEIAVLSLNNNNVDRYIKEKLSRQVASEIMKCPSFKLKKYKDFIKSQHYFSLSVPFLKVNEQTSNMRF